MKNLVLLAALGLVAYFDYQTFFPLYVSEDMRQSEQRAAATYPALGIQGSALEKLYARRYQQLLDRHDPLLKQSDWPEKLVEQCVRDLPEPAPAIPHVVMVASQAGH